MKQDLKHEIIKAGKLTLFVIGPMYGAPLMQGRYQNYHPQNLVSSATQIYFSDAMVET